MFLDEWLPDCLDRSCPGLNVSLNMNCNQMEQVMTCGKDKMLAQDMSEKFDSSFVKASFI